MNKYIICIISLILIWLLIFINKDNIFHNSKEEVVNVYSSRKEDLVKNLFNNFTKSTRIKVNYINDEAAQLITRIESEGANSKADVFLTADAVNLILAKKKNLLLKVDSPMLNSRIPKKFRDPEGYWFGLTKRARIIVFNKNKLARDSLSTYENLVDTKFRNKILVRSSNSPYNQSLIAFMIANHGSEFVKKWVKGLVNNMARKPSGGDTDQIYAVSAGEGDLCVVNSYYFGRILASKKERDIKASKNLNIFFPNQNEGEGGAMINISGAAIIKSAKNKKNALKLLEFLVSDDSQKLYSEVNFEYPIVEGIGISEILKLWGTFKESDLSLQRLEEHLREAVHIADLEGWR